MIASGYNFRIAAAVAVALISVLATDGAQAVVLDWSPATWGAGTTSNSFDASEDGVADITVAVTASNNTFTNDTATGTMTPAVNQSITGGLSPVENTLVIAGDLKTHSDATVHLTFTGNYPGGANNVSFSIFDIDLGTNSDIIDTIYGVKADGSQVAATITNVGSAIGQSGSGLTAALTGNVVSANSGAGSSNGNATISFGSTYVTDIFFTFSNTAGAPRYQEIALGDISFTPVPELNPALSAVVVCAIAAAVAVRQRRRRHA